MLKCNLCDFEAVNARSLASHLQTAHSMSTKEYTIRTMHGGICPTCAFCGAEVRYVSFSFKKYCKEHSFMAESEAGAFGGKNKKTWNKGLTKEQDSRIMECSNRNKGSGNPSFKGDGTEAKPRTISRADISVLSCPTAFAKRIKRKSDRVVIFDPKIAIEFIYPLSHAVLIDFEKVDGFTVKDLRCCIRKGYEQIYSEEDSQCHPSGVGNIPGTYNRARSNGPHGIWGHVIGDLFIEGIYYNDADKVVTMSIGS